MKHGDLLSQYFEQAIRAAIDAAYLFGSVAHGRQHADSDVDVAVLFSRTGLRDSVSRAMAAEQVSADLIAVLHSNQVDVVPLNDAAPLFARAIIQKGVRLYAQDAGIIHAFEPRGAKRNFDFRINPR